MNEKQPKWKTRDGKCIAISDMSDSHLLNAFRMLQRMEQDYLDMVKCQDHPVFGPRGDGAQMAFESELDHAAEQAMTILPWQILLRTEIDKRGLEPLEVKPLDLPEYELVEDLGAGKLYKIKGA